MAILNVQDVGASGLAPAFAAAAAGGDEFPLSEHVVLRVKNGGAASITVTLKTKKPSNYGESNDVVFNVAAGAEMSIRPGAIKGGIERFANGNGRAEVTYSAVASVTVAVVGA